MSAIPQLISGGTTPQLFLTLSHLPPTQAPSVLVTPSASVGGVVFYSASTGNANVLITAQQQTFTITAPSLITQNITISFTCTNPLYYSVPSPVSVRVVQQGARVL